MNTLEFPNFMTGSQAVKALLDCKEEQELEQHFKSSTENRQTNAYK